MANAVLVAEPEPSTRGFLERHLKDDGFDVLGAEECGEALELAERARPDLVLLGDTAALDECRSWSSEVPLIVIGAPEADAVDRVRALERGADDFLTRPFLYDELLARIRAVLRRTAPVVPALVHVGSLEIDRPTRRVSVGGKRIDLPAKEYELLLKLASEPKRVFTKEELLREVWGFRSIGKTRTLDSHASRLRRKLARGGGEPFVVNVWGVGYRLLED
jgi:DNA-binding response OmpR family regulator